MKNALLFLISVLYVSVTSGQPETEWLVEMNPDDGTFEAVGPSLNEVHLIYTGVQCKNEANKEYVFIRDQPGGAFFSVGIEDAQIKAVTPYPYDLTVAIWGIHCYQNCDSLIFVGYDNHTDMNFVEMFDRFNEGAPLLLGDSIPDDNPDTWNVSHFLDAFDPVTNKLYLFSPYAATIRQMDIPSAEITNEYLVTRSPWVMAFDEVAGKLYGIERSNNNLYTLLLFDPNIGDFVPVGNSFSSISEGYATATIDGNNQRIFVTRYSDYSGSFMMSVDLPTGELIADINTMPGTEDGGGFFGGPNVLMGQYFNSTNQLIALHWGTESTVTSRADLSQNRPNVLISPNPNNGDFRIKIQGVSGAGNHLKIMNVNGQLVYENSDIGTNQFFDLELSAGYYIATVEERQGLALYQAPLVIAH